MQEQQVNCIFRIIGVRIQTLPPTPPLQLDCMSLNECVMVLPARW